VDPAIIYIKRCIGLPGETVQIKNTTALINNSELEVDHGVKFKYIVSSSFGINRRVLASVGVTEDDYHPVSGELYSMFLTQEQFEELRQLAFITKIERSIAVNGNPEQGIFPTFNNGWQNTRKWNTDHFGPLYIPRRGDRIELTAENYYLYGQCIRLENENVLLADEQVHIDGKKITTYEFKDNYYFMMGDSRHNSLDSRYWGFVPEKFIIGKALYLYWSGDFGRVGQSIK
jgi:signal peptidase I